MSAREPSAPGDSRLHSGGDFFFSCSSGWCGSRRRGASRGSFTRWLCGMLFVLALWCWDLSRMARPEQIEVRRVWDEPLGLAKRMPVTIELQQFFARRDFRQDHRRDARDFLPRSAEVRDRGARGRPRAARRIRSSPLARRRAIRRRLAALPEPRGAGRAMGARAPAANRARLSQYRRSAEDAHLPDPQPPDRAGKAAEAAAGARARIRKPARLSRGRRISRHLLERDGAARKADHQGASDRAQPDDLAGARRGHGCCARASTG